MAAVPGLTKKQNAALAGLNIGDILIIYQDEVLYDSHGNMTEYDSDGEPVMHDDDDQGGDNDLTSHDEDGSDADAEHENVSDAGDGSESGEQSDGSHGGEVSGSEEGADEEQAVIVSGSVNASAQTEPVVSVNAAQLLLRLL